MTKRSTVALVIRIAFRGSMARSLAVAAFISAMVLAFAAAWMSLGSFTPLQSAQEVFGDSTARLQMADLLGFSRSEPQQASSVATALDKLPKVEGVLETFDVRPDAPEAGFVGYREEWQAKSFVDGRL